jgi:hypothetical protein
MITLRFVTTRGDAISDGIRRFEYGYWATHVEALMPDGALLGAHADGGVLARNHDYDKGQFTQEEYVTIRATADETDSFHTFLRAQVGKPYDFFGVAGIALGRIWQDPGKWFCSELIAAALCHCGVFPPHLATEFNHITPRDVLLIVSGRLDLAA